MIWTANILGVVENATILWGAIGLVLGAIGVVELRQAVDMREIQPAFVEQGVWVRPFGKLVYLMPPFIIDEEDLSLLTSAVVRVISAAT